MKKILITGTSNGIGNALLKEFSKDNICIAVGRHVNSQNDNSHIKYLKCDLSKKGEVIKLGNLIKTMQIDILINNAGYGKPKNYEHITLEQLEYEINLNLIAPMLLIQSVLPYMKKKTWGRIINISSVSAKTGTPFLSVYSAAKAGLNSITQSVGKEIKSQGITINSICPGGVDTKMSIEGRREISLMSGFEGREIYENSMKNAMGLENLINPESIVEYVKYLVSEKGYCINGQSVNICGVLEVH